jgi:hypothetical protein
MMGEVGHTPFLTGCRIITGSSRVSYYYYCYSCVDLATGGSPDRADELFVKQDTVSGGQLDCSTGVMRNDLFPAFQTRNTLTAFSS